MKWSMLSLAGLALFLLGVLGTLYGYYNYNPCFCPPQQAPCQCPGGERATEFFQIGLILIGSGLLTMFAAQVWKNPGVKRLPIG